MKVKVLNTETQIEVREMDLDDWVDQLGECSLGRSPYSGLVLDSPDVSRLHAKFAFESGHYYFYDLGSSNGSMVNGRVVAPQQKQLLKPGDIIRVGEFMLTLHRLDEKAESLPATVIGGSEMTILERLPALTNSQLSSLEVAASNQLDTGSSETTQPELLLEPLKPEVPEIEAQTQTKDSLPLESLLEEAILSDLLSNDELSDQQSCDQSAESNSPDAVSTQPFESEFTIIQLEPSVDLSELPADETALPLAEVVKTFDHTSEDTSNSSSGSSHEEPTFIQLDETSESQANSHDPILYSGINSDESSEPEPLFDSIEALIEPTPELASQIEVLLPEPDEITDTATPELAVVEPIDSELNIVSDLDSESDGALYSIISDSETTLTKTETSEIQSSELLDQSSDNADQQTELPLTQSTADPNQIEESHRIEPEVESTIETNLVSKLSLTELIDEASNTSLWNGANNVEEIEVAVSDADNATKSDTDTSIPTEYQSALSEKYVALLAHDSQISALAELVSHHKAFFTSCLTVTTPTVSEVLKQQTGLETSCQTPALSVGGYQTINSLITADKVAAVIFLRDFLNAQVNSANDEAFSRACNIHQVLFASNVPTADVLMQHLQNVMIER